MRKIINNAEYAISEMLQGMVNTHKNLAYIPKLEVITRKGKSSKVGLVSGGGSGHEPAHAGYVGYGMLDAAVCGNVFSSPSPDRIIKGIEEADSGEGVLLIIKNYSGDNMNFKLAQELALMDDHKTEIVVVKDDVAVPDSTYSTGRRGIAGTVFVHKIAGAKAEMGASLKEVKQIAERVIANVRSMGVSLSSCILPGVSEPVFTLEENQIGVGIGIHGEPGIEVKPMMSATEICETLIGKILADYDYSNSEVAVMINGLGATPLMELYIMQNEVEKFLMNNDIKIVKSFVGNYMTALEMAGLSISLLKLDKEMKVLLDFPCDTPGLTICGDGQ